MEKGIWNDDDQKQTLLMQSIPHFSTTPNEKRVVAEEGNIKEMRPILRYILANPIKLPSDPLRRLTFQELKEAAYRRKRDLENVVAVLKSPENIKALDASWMYDFVNTKENDLNSLAKLLVDEKYDSPWILRPDYFDTLSSTLQRVKLGEFSSSTNFVSEHLPKDRMRNEDLKKAYSVDDKPVLKPDLMLGLAGFLPVARDGLDDDMLHESWLEDVQRHVTFEKDKSDKSNTVSLVYGKRCLDGSPRQTYLLARQTQASLAVLIHVMMELRELKMIPPKSLPILIRGPLINTVEVVDMYFSDYKALWESMAALVKELESEVPDARETAILAESFRPDRELVIKQHSLFSSFVMLLVFAMSSLYAVCFKSTSDRNSVGFGNDIEQTSPGAGSSNQQDRGRARREERIPEKAESTRSYIDSQSELLTSKLESPPPNQVKDVLSLIFTRIKAEHLITPIPDKQHRISPYSFNAILVRYPLLSILIPEKTTNSRKHNTPSVESELLHYAALSVQIMSLGLQAYAQAHTGELEFSFIDRGVSKVILKGGGLASKVATAELQQLTCFGNVTRSSVLVFKIDDIENGGSEQDTGPCDVISSLDNIANIWGGPQLGRWEGLTHHHALNYQKGLFWIGGGILYPTSHVDINFCLWHWLSETDSRFPQILSDTERIFSNTLIETAFPLRIGATRINTLCPGSSEIGHREFRNIAQDHLNDLEAFAPYWELTNVQGGIQGGQWIVPQVMLGWQKLPGRTRKQAMLDPSNSLLIPEIYKVWGIQLSLCTGILRRVPLQQVIASCVESYMAGRLPPLPEWPNLREKLNMIDALSRPDLGGWFQNLPLDYQAPAAMIIKEVLNKLQHTGVDEQENLRVGWADPFDGFQCLTIPCRKHNSWARMLIDSTELATFACVTNLCLETCNENRTMGSRGHSRLCSGIIPQRFNPTPPLQLSTQVRPRGVDYHSRTTAQNWSLEKGKSYWMGRDDLMLMATVDVDSGETMLKIKRSTMPVKLFKRMNSRATVRETNDRGAVNCLVVSDAS